METKEIKDLKIKAIQRIIDESIKLGKLSGLQMLFQKLEELTGKKLPKEEWLSLKKLFIKSGKPALVNNLYYSRWNKKVNSEQYKKDIFKGAKIALKNKDVTSYINAYRDIEKRLQKKKILSIVEEKNYEFFGPIYYDSYINRVTDFYNGLKREIPKNLLLHIHKESIKKLQFYKYFWACEQLSKKPLLSMVEKYYDDQYSKGDLSGMKEAKKMLGKKLSKATILKQAKAAIKNQNSGQAEMWLVEYYS